MEDFELVQKLRRASAGGAGRIETLPDAAECSGRRWEARGVWRTNLTNQVWSRAHPPAYPPTLTPPYPPTPRPALPSAASKAIWHQITSR